ncbi:MAG: hypothetical protein AAF292_11140 [Pseudomonadota bacterium]
MLAFIGNHWSLHSSVMCYAVKFCDGYRHPHLWPSLIGLLTPRRVEVDQGIIEVRLRPRKITNGIRSGTRRQAPDDEVDQMFCVRGLN